MPVNESSYSWNPPASEIQRICKLIDAGKGDVDIAEDQGVDPADIAHIRALLWSRRKPKRSLSEVLSDIRYKDGWSFLIFEQGRYLQVQLPPDSTGTVWKGRKWQLSEHMTEGEIVQTALMACLTAEEHEARESFTYKGKALFGPHISIDKLLSIADDIEMREPSK